MSKARIVAIFDQFVVDVGIRQYLQLLDVLNHFPGFVGNEGMHKSRRPDGDSYADHTIHLHDVVGRIVVNLEDVLEAL